MTTTKTTTEDERTPAGTLARVLELVARVDGAAPSAVQQNPERFRLLAEQATASAAFVQARAAEVRMLVAVLDRTDNAGLNAADVVRNLDEYALIVDRVRALIGLTEPAEAGE